MLRNVLIVIEGGRIQDILCDDPDIRVTVKNFDDTSSAETNEAAIDNWPVNLVDGSSLDAVIKSR